MKRKPDQMPWMIKTTSDDCPYCSNIKDFLYQKELGYQCGHPDNSSKFCTFEKCTIRKKGLT